MTPQLLASPARESAARQLSHERAARQARWAEFYQLTACHDPEGREVWRAYRTDGRGMVGAHSGPEIEAIMATDFLLCPVRRESP